jgi:hypothetical protein
MKLLRVIKIIPLLALCSSAVNAGELSVSGATIFYTNSHSVEYSKAADETVIENRDGDAIQFNVLDHIVARGEGEKASFTPLKSNSSNLTEVSSYAGTVAGLNLPDAYRALSTLHLRFTTEGGRSNRICKILILDNLLHEADKTRLRSLLHEQQISYETNNGYLAAQCGLASGVTK